MFELPLFPLNTVLFPGMPITLHIFEARYKDMIEFCLDNQQPFGVVLIKQGTEALGPLAEPYPVGCSARIAQVEPLDNGNMNILAIGLERFRIHSMLYDRPYLVGIVDLFPLSSDYSPTLTHNGERLRRLVERYLAILAQAVRNEQIDPSRLPHDPLALGYLAASMLQIPLGQKQALLAAGQAADFLADTYAFYRRELALLNVILAHQTHQEWGPFSPN